MSIGSALAVLRELNIHNLTRSTNHAGEKQTKKKKNECRKSFFSIFHFKCVCKRDQGNEVGLRAAYAHNVL